MANKNLVLIVDDNPQNLQFLAEILDNKGYEPAVALNGMEALNFIKAREDIDAVLLDVMMPEMDGYATCREIRKFKTRDDLPVIFLTALSDRKDIYRGFEAGGVDYITKPFDSEELLHRLEIHIELSHAKRELRKANDALQEKNLELSRMQKTLELQASTDPLTETLNRRAMRSKIEVEISRAVRYQHNFSLIFLDIDHFKTINDQFGHDKGDYALIELAGILKELVRSGDAVSRWGGEEFLVLLLNSDEKGSQIFGQRLMENIRNRDWSEISDGYQLTATAGIVAYRDGEAFENLIKRADEAMYRGKSAGRDQIVCG
jgi:diguanylate cyclase (GGDEF)-like protein